MCYSDRLSRFGGYNVDGRWVLVGWKAIDTSVRIDILRPMITVWRSRCPGMLTEFEPGTLQPDPTPHGFHVAASKFRAIRALFNMKYFRPVGDLPCAHRHTAFRARYEITQLKNIAIIRVLVPEIAMRDDGHVDAMMIIAPGERETPAQVRAASHYLREDLPAEILQHGNP